MVQRKEVQHSFEREYRTNSNSENTVDKNDPYWDRQLNKLMDELHTSINSPSDPELYGALSPRYSSKTRVTSGLSSPSLVRRGVSPGPGQGVQRNREEFTTPDKKRHIVKENYSYETKPTPDSHNYVTSRYYSSRYNSDGIDARDSHGNPLPAITYNGTVTNDERIYDSTASTLEKRYRGGGDRGVECTYSSNTSPVVTSTPAQLGRSNSFRSAYRHFEDLDRHQTKEPFTLGSSSLKRAQSLDRKPVADAAWHRDVSSDRSYTSKRQTAASNYNTYSSDSGRGTTERKSRRDDFMNSLTRGHLSPREAFEEWTSEFGSLDRRSRRPSWEEHRSRSPTPKNRRDASPIRPGYGSEWVDGQDVVRKYNYEYMHSGGAENTTPPRRRSPSPERISVSRTVGKLRSPSPRNDLNDLMETYKETQRDFKTDSPAPNTTQTTNIEKTIERTVMIKREDGNYEPNNNHINHTAITEKAVTNGRVSPAPVYYPQTYQEGRGEKWWKTMETEKGKGKFKFSEKEKGAIAVPVCLPLCCAAPLCCTIM